MQLLKAAIDLLIVFASYNLIPSDPVLLSLSLPAKSTTVKRAFLKCLFFTLFEWAEELLLLISTDSGELL